MGKAENKIESYLRKQSLIHNFDCYKFISPGNNGVPDRIVIGNGKTVFVETKSETGSLRELQQEVTNDMRSKGAIVYTAHTKEEVDDIINDLLKN